LICFATTLQLRNLNIIQKTLAVGMLLLFAFSTMPKKYLHDLVADHKDFYSFQSADEATVYQTGFNCHCDDVVVSTPFVEASFTFNVAALPCYKAPAFSSYNFYFLNSCSTKDSRGPPAVG
jgi:hypothetical protein